MMIVMIVIAFMNSNFWKRNNRWWCGFLYRTNIWIQKCLSKLNKIRRSIYKYVENTWFGFRTIENLFFYQIHPDEIKIFDIPSTILTSLSDIFAAVEFVLTSLSMLLKVTSFCYFWLIYTMICSILLVPSNLSVISEIYKPSLDH